MAAQLEDASETDHRALNGSEASTSRVRRSASDLGPPRPVRTEEVSLVPVRDPPERSTFRFSRSPTLANSAPSDLPGLEPTRTQHAGIFRLAERREPSMLRFSGSPTRSTLNAHRSSAFRIWKIPTRCVFPGRRPDRSRPAPLFAGSRTRSPPNVLRSSGSRIRKIPARSVFPDRRPGSISTRSDFSDRRSGKSKRAPFRRLADPPRTEAQRFSGSGTRPRLRDSVPGGSAFRFVRVATLSSVRRRVRPARRKDPPDPLRKHGGTCVRAHPRAPRTQHSRSGAEKTARRRRAQCSPLRHRAARAPRRTGGLSPRGVDATRRCVRRSRPSVGRTHRPP